MAKDRLGRRRTPDQERGLRPMHPALPVEWTSKAIRVAMSESDWVRFEALTQVCAAIDPAPTRARAYGRSISGLMRHAEQSAPGALAWMDWERQKTLRLLRFAV